jgi:hypothetical protein
MITKLTRFFAGYLIVLVLLPFTAPWSVCRIGDIGAAFMGGPGVPLPSPASAAVDSITRVPATDPATTVVTPVETRQRRSQSVVRTSIAGSAPVIVPLFLARESIEPSRRRHTGDRSSDARLTSLRL